MFSNIKIAGLSGIAPLRSSKRDHDWPRSARLPWWVSEEILEFGRAEPTRIGSGPECLESDFLRVSLTPLPARAAKRENLFAKLLDAVQRMTAIPQRIKVAQA